MSMLSPYRLVGSHDFSQDSNQTSQSSESGPLRFVSLLEFVSGIYQVVENGNPLEQNNWFPDIEPLFKLLGYENVPPYLKVALRNAITTFVKKCFQSVSCIMNINVQDSPIYRERQPAQEQLCCHTSIPNTMLFLKDYSLIAAILTSLTFNQLDTVWSYLEQYDLPVVVGSHVGKSAQPMAAQVGF
ncbi:hypothetical protein ACLB2K_007554 [Fragaria x ananassa]